MAVATVPRMCYDAPVKGYVLSCCTLIKCKTVAGRMGNLQTLLPAVGLQQVLIGLSKANLPPKESAASQSAME
jgi:hypothetical protein